MPKIDLKLIVAAAFLLGLFAGFYIDNKILNKPKNTSSTETMNNQFDAITL